MLKLLIVDDEPIIREGLKNGFEWGEVGYEVCGTAGSGMEAIGFIERCRPDVMITDIAMSKTDGLELLRYISENGLGIYSVVLSGYNSFEYARTAMRYGVCSYFLKPIDKDELFGALLSLREKIESERRARSRDENIRLMVDLSRRDIAEQAMKRFLMGDPDGAQARFLLGQCNPGYLSDRYALAALDCVRAAMLPALRKAAMRFFDAYDLCDAMMIPVEGMLVVLMCLHGAARERLIIKQLLLSLDGCPRGADVRCRITRSVADFEQLPEDFRLLRAACDGGFYDDFGEIYTARVREHDKTAGATEGTPEPGDELCDAIIEKRREHFEAAVGAYLSGIKNMGFDKNTVVDRCFDGYMALRERMHGIYPSLEAAAYGEAHAALSECASFSQLGALYRDMLNALYDDVLEVSDEKSSFIRKLKRYIDDNYMSRLSLERLSEVFFLNPAYLSALFCQLTGMTITGYIRKVRFEKAKELLLQSDMSVLDIAEAVGYTNHRHFSSLFKELYRQTPTNFRLTQKRTVPDTRADGDGHGQK